MGVDTRRLYIITSAIGGALAGLAACLLVLHYDVHPFVGLTFGPITFLICVLGGLGNMVGGFVAAFLFAEIISVGGLFSTWNGATCSPSSSSSSDVHPPGRAAGEALMKARHLGVCGRRQRC